MLACSDAQGLPVVGWLRGLGRTVRAVSDPGLREDPVDYLRALGRKKDANMFENSSHIMKGAAGIKKTMHLTGPHL